MSLPLTIEEEIESTFRTYAPNRVALLSDGYYYSKCDAGIITKHTEGRSIAFRIFDQVASHVSRYHCLNPLLDFVELMGTVYKPKWPINDAITEIDLRCRKSFPCKNLNCNWSFGINFYNRSCEISAHNYPEKIILARETNLSLKHQITWNNNIKYTFDKLNIVK